MCAFFFNNLEWLLIINEIQTTIRVCSGNTKSSKRQSAIIVAREIKDNIYNPILRELGFLIQNNMYMYSVWFIIIFIKIINDA